MEKTIDRDFLLNFPLIVSKNSANKEFVGYIVVNDDFFPIHLQIKRGRLKCDINHKLRPFEQQINLIHEDNLQYPSEFLTKLTVILENSNKPVARAINTSVYRRVLNEFVEFKNFHISIESAALSNDLQTITICTFDGRRRKHTLDIGLSDDFKEFQILACDLPDSEDNITTEKSLISLYDKYLAILEKLQEFFNLMDEIDGSYCVLDPAEPKRKDCFRRIALDNKLSFVITVNPLVINEIPTIKFLGPHNDTKTLTERYHRNFLVWNREDHLLANILRILEIEELPPKPIGSSTNDSKFNTGECCICFSLRFDDKLPEVVCPNSCCNQFFHTQCLYQWLCSLNLSKFYVEKLGPCPNCEKPIQCPIPEEQQK